MLRNHGLMAITMLAAALAAGCVHYVTVQQPPVVELRNMEMVGVVKFEVLEGDSALSDDATHRFIATVQHAQPGTRVLDLGTKEEILTKVRARQLDAAAIQEIGKVCGVDAVITGNVTFKNPRPRVNITSLTRASASVKVDASMQAMLRETERGSMIWTNGASGTWTLGRVAVSGHSVGSRTADPVQKHAQIMTELVQITTNDFRPTWERQRVND